MDTASTWAAMCRRAQSHAQNMAHGCCQQAAELIFQEAKEFTGQKPPQTDDELALRSRQSHALNSKIRTICHANNMASSHPAVASQILEEAEGCCGLQATDAAFKILDQRINEITAKIRNLCFDDLSRRTIEGQG